MSSIFPTRTIPPPESPVIGDLLVYVGTNWLAYSPGTSGYCLISNGPGAVPTWQSVLTGDAGLSSLAAADAGAGLPYVTLANTWTRLALAANKGIYATAAGAMATYDLSAFARSLLDDADAATMRGTLGLVIGTDVQAYDADLAALAALASAADKVPYATGSGTWALADFTSYGRSLVAVASEAAFKALVNLEVGVDVAAYDAAAASRNALASTYMMRWAHVSSAGGAVGVGAVAASEVGSSSYVYRDPIRLRQYTSPTSGAGDKAGAALTSGAGSVVDCGNDWTLWFLCGTTSSNTNVRALIGASAGQPTNNDVPTGNNWLLVRWTQGTDTQFTAIGKATGSASAGAAFGPTIATDKTYLVRIRYDASAATAYFGAVEVAAGSPIDLFTSFGTEASVTTVPAAGSVMGWVCQGYVNVVGTAVNWLWSETWFAPGVCVSP